MVDHRYLFKISVVSECIVKRIGDLPFDFNIGSCGTFIVDSLVTILLCFSASNDRRGCRSLTRRNNDPLSSIEDFAFDAEFEVDRVVLPDTTHDHWMSSMAAYQGFPLVLERTIQMILTFFVFINSSQSDIFITFVAKSFGEIDH